MSKFTFFLATLLIGLFYILHFDKALTDRFSQINTLKKLYVKQADIISENISSFFNQATKIKELTLTNQKLLNYKNLYISSNTELTNIQNGTSSLYNKDESMQMAKVLSYVNFNDFSKVWLDIDKYDEKNTRFSRW